MLVALEHPKLRCGPGHPFMLQQLRVSCLPLHLTPTALMAKRLASPESDYRKRLRAAMEGFLTGLRLLFAFSGHFASRLPGTPSPARSCKPPVQDC